MEEVIFKRAHVSADDDNAIFKSAPPIADDSVTKRGSTSDAMRRHNTKVHIARDLSGIDPQVRAKLFPEFMGDDPKTLGTDFLAGAMQNYAKQNVRPGESWQQAYSRLINGDDVMKKFHATYKAAQLTELGQCNTRAQFEKREAAAPAPDQIRKRARQILEEMTQGRDLSDAQAEQAYERAFDIAASEHIRAVA